MCYQDLFNGMCVFLRPSLGVCQVYYECVGLGDPLSYKSPGTQRLLSHLRHPVCLELSVVLWLLPALSLDRLLLALTMSVYLALAHSLDKQDLTFLCEQLIGKLQLFAEPQRGRANQHSNHKAIQFTRLQHKEDFTEPDLNPL